MRVKLNYKERKNVYGVCKLFEILKAVSFGITEKGSFQANSF